VLRGRDVQEIEELKRQGLSIRAISRLTGYDRENHPRVSDPARSSTGVWTTTDAAEQAGCIQTIHRRAPESRRVERTGAAAGAVRPRLCWRVHDSEKLPAPVSQNHTAGCCW